MKGSKFQLNEAFFQTNNKSKGAASLSKLFKDARKSGQLNISSKGLTSLPAEIFALETQLEDDEKFWEIVPLSKLDASHNNISEIPPDFQRLVDVQVLKLRNNAIREVPPSLVACANLRHVDMSNNKIETIADAMQTLWQLKELYLGSNCLREIPESLFACAALQTLELHENQLSSISDSIASLRQMVHLTLHSNQLTSLPIGIEHLSILQTLDIKKNRLSSLPDLSYLKHLVLLDARENRLTEIPSLPQGALGRLHLEHNQMRQIDMSRLLVCQQSLFELHISNNSINTLPPEIGFMEKLKVLDVSNNDLSDLPPALGYTAQLQRVTLDGNPLRAIRRSLLSQSTHELKKYLRTRGPPLDGMKCCTDADLSLTSDESSDLAIESRFREMTSETLNLSNLQLRNFPAEWIDKLQRARDIDALRVTLSLVKLDLSKNLFTEIPTLLSKVTTLREVILAENKLSESANQQGYIFDNLHFLDVSSNALTSYHVSMMLAAPSALCNLRSIHLNINRLDRLPPELMQHSALRELQASFNNMTNLDNFDFSLLTRLEILDVGNNKLHSIGNVYRASALTTLLLNNNELHEIPAEVGLLKNLTSLNIHGNPQKLIRTHVLQRGVEAVLKVLRMRLDASSATVTVRGDMMPPPPTDTMAVSHRNTGMRIPHQDIASFKEPGAAIVSSSSRIDSRKHGMLGSAAAVAAPAPAHFPSQQMAQEKPPAVPNVDHALADMDKLNREVQQLENSLSNPSLTEAKRFALKKQMAKARANLIRLRKTLDK